MEGGAPNARAELFRSICAAAVSPREPLLKTVLEDATAMLPEAKRTSVMKAEIASHILASAAKGERNPTTLKIAALSAVVECTHYSHDISPERRVV